MLNAIGDGQPVELILMIILIIIIITMEIHAAPKLSRYTTALGAYTIKSFTSDINQRTHAHTNKQKPHIHTHTHTRARTQAHEHEVRNSY